MNVTPAYEDEIIVTEVDKLVGTLTGDVYKESLVDIVCDIVAVVEVDVTELVDVTVMDLADQLEDVNETDDGDTLIDPDTDGVTVTVDVGWTFKEI